MEMSKNSLRHNSSVDYLRDILFFVCFSLGANKSWELRRAASTEYTKTEKQTLFFPPLQSVRHACIQLASVAPICQNTQEAVWLTPGAGV